MHAPMICVKDVRWWVKNLCLFNKMIKVINEAANKELTKIKLALHHLLDADEI